MQNRYDLVKMRFWPRVIAVSYCLLFILVPLIWLPNTSELFEFPKILVAYLITIVIVASWLCRMIAEKRWIFRRTSLDIPLVIFLSISFLSSLLSIDTHVSFYGYYSRFNGGLLSLLSYALLYWAFVSNITREAIPKLINCLLITVGTIAVYGGLEHFGFSPSCLVTRGSFGVDCWVQDVQTRVFATLGQPNWLAAYLAVLIFIPISKLLSKKDYLFSLERIILYGVSLLLFVVLLFTKSRSGLLAFGVSAAVFWGLYFWKLGKLKNYLGFGIWCLVIATLIFSVSNPLRDLVVKSTTPAPVGPALEVGGTESGNIRKIVWTGAVRIWTANFKNFLVGTGPETFAMAYYQYRPIEHNATSEWELLYNKAHNEFLNYLATTGITGLLSYLLLLVVISRVFIKTIYDHRMTTNDNYMTIALLAGWISIPITNFWGFSVVITQLFLWLFPALIITLNDH